MTAPAPTDYRALATSLAQKYDLPFFPAQIQQESGFDPNARSSAGAVGIAQIVPKYHPGVDPTDPVASLEYAAKYMRGLVDKYGGDAAKALSVYNSGNPTAYLDPHFASGQTTRYVHSILGTGATTSHTSVPQPGTVDPATATPLAQPSSPSAFRAQALGNLKDIASGTVQPTDALGKLPSLLKQVGAAMPTLPTITASSSSEDAQAVALAKKYLGVKYAWGGTNASTGFDCSGLLQTVWKQLGVAIPRTTYDQWSAGKAVAAKSLRPGDAVFFTGSDAQNGKPGHVGMYIGGGKFIEAPHTGSDVHISTLAGRTDFVGARRFG